MIEMIDIKEVCRMLGCKKSSVWEHARKNPAFPKPYRYEGVRCTRWRKSEVEAYLDRAVGE